MDSQNVPERLEQIGRQEHRTTAWEYGVYGNVAAPEMKEESSAGEGSQIGDLFWAFFCTMLAAELQKVH